MFGPHQVLEIIPCAPAALSDSFAHGARGHFPCPMHRTLASVIAACLSYGHDWGTLQERDPFMLLHHAHTHAHAHPHYPKITQTMTTKNSEVSGGVEALTQQSFSIGGDHTHCDVVCLAPNAPPTHPFTGKPPRLKSIVMIFQRTIKYQISLRLSLAHLLSPSLSTTYTDHDDEEL